MCLFLNPIGLDLVFLLLIITSHDQTVSWHLHRMFSGFFCSQLYIDLTSRQTIHICFSPFWFKYWQIISIIQEVVLVYEGCVICVGHVGSDLYFPDLTVFWTTFTNFSIMFHVCPCLSRLQTAGLHKVICIFILRFARFVCVIWVAVFCKGVEILRNQFFNLVFLVVNQQRLMSVCLCPSSLFACTS